MGKGKGIGPSGHTIKKMNKITTKRNNWHSPLSESSRGAEHDMAGVLIGS